MMMEYAAYTIVALVTSVIVLAWALIAVIFFKLFKEISEDRNKIRTCKWIHDSSETYKTECGKLFYNSKDDGSPVTDWATHCPYCGKLII